MPTFLTDPRKGILAIAAMLFVSIIGAGPATAATEPVIEPGDNLILDITLPDKREVEADVRYVTLGKMVSKRGRENTYDLTTGNLTVKLDRNGTTTFHGSIGNGRFPEAPGLLAVGMKWEQMVRTTEPDGKNESHVRACEVTDAGQHLTAGRVFPDAVTVVCTLTVPGYPSYETVTSTYSNSADPLHRLPLFEKRVHKERGTTIVRLARANVTGLDFVSAAD